MRDPTPMGSPSPARAALSQWRTWTPLHTLVCVHAQRATCCAVAIAMRPITQGALATLSRRLLQTPGFRKCRSGQARVMHTVSARDVGPLFRGKMSCLRCLSSATPLSATPAKSDFVTFVAQSLLLPNSQVQQHTQDYATDTSIVLVLIAIGSMG